MLVANRDDTVVAGSIDEGHQLGVTAVMILSGAYDSDESWGQYLRDLLPNPLTF